MLIGGAGELPLEHASRFFERVNRPYTMTMTSNETVGDWAGTCGDNALATAVLDRLLHDVESPALEGPASPEGPPGERHAVRGRGARAA